jgi:hypothetical protein
MNRDTENLLRLMGFVTKMTKQAREGKERHTQNVVRGVRRKHKVISVIDQQGRKP